jgi:two-component system invasion response regulator UvrY
VHINVLIADDAVGVTDAVGEALAAREPRLKIVGRTALPEQVPSLFIQTKPDVVLLDVRFGHEEKNTGLEITQKLLAIDSRARVVLFSQFDQDEIIIQAYQIGALAFLPKSAPLKNVVDALLQVQTGKRYFLPNIAERMAEASLEPREPRQDGSPQALLEPRELEVFRLLALGQNNADIGEALGLSSKTISAIAQSLKKKLDVEKPAELTLLAVKHKIITP